MLIAGSGSIGRRHIGNLQQLVPAAEFILVRRNGRRDSFSDALGASVVASVDEGHAAGADCLVVANPTALHADMIRSGMAEHLPMYIEKPLVASREEAGQVRDTVESTHYQSPVMAGCNLRFLPSLRMLRQHLRGGTIGSIARVNMEAGQWLPDWRPVADYRSIYSASAALGGGVVLDLVHEFDAARWLVDEFPRVAAIGGRFEPLRIDAEAVCTAIMTPACGAPVVSVSVDYVARQLIRRYEFVGEHGTLIWDLPGRKLTLHTASATTELADADADFDMGRTYIDAMKEFLACVKSGEATSQGLEEGLASAELAVRVRESLCQQ